MTTHQLLTLLSIVELTLACIIITILFIVSVIGYYAMVEILKGFDDTGNKDDDNDIHKVNY